jgi:hypothetical protein
VRDDLVQSSWPVELKRDPDGWEARRVLRVDPAIGVDADVEKKHVQAFDHPAGVMREENDTRRVTDDEVLQFGIGQATEAARAGPQRRRKLG